MDPKESYLLYIMLTYLSIILISLLAHLALYIFKKTYLPRRKRCTERWISILHEKGANHCLTDRQIRKLKRDIDLAAWSDALKEYKRSGGEPEVFVNRNDRALSRLGIMIRREDIRAYYAYVLTSINREGRVKSRSLKALMEVYLESGRSMYLRENALKGIYSFRDPVAVLAAWLTLSKRKLYHDSKLLGNDLSEYPGDMQRLTALLMSRYEELEENFQIALINTLRFHKITAFNRQLKEELYREDASVDIKCCVIRLLGLEAVDYTGIFVDILGTYMNNEVWEPAAVAAIALKGGEEELGKPALFQALTSRNWYVRKNVAMTLATYGLSDREKGLILEGDDRYARDALNWALNR
ncbi:MAG: HEAT repeat domain-containing protein [Lachnospiraceae bacterium]|nr:HEAT repeat domain-containing protein [Lachnospiraceae bacterium]MBQ5430276.1 HEAT repeat domain-containing protein [Lachnospiraceae bacterium]